MSPVIAPPTTAPRAGGTSVSSAISCSGLLKRFGSTTALDGLDLQIERGEIHGFLGPNGAGKTVTMRILLGLLRHDGGSVSVLGADPWRDAVELHRRLAYVPGDTNLWPNLTGGEIIDILGGLRGGLDPTRRARLIEQFELDPSKKARSYSKGNRQKVALIAALAADVELLVLDEPTSGLDPLMEATFQHEIRHAREHGRTVLLSSHILGEVEKLCDRVTLIRRGRAVQTGTLDDLRHLTRTTITAHTGLDPSPLGAQRWAHDFRCTADTVSFQVDEVDLDDALRQLAALGVHSLVSRPPSLEEMFLRHYGDELAAAGVHAEHTP
jgi:ABC-2 type transport system ATP-binding protein